MDGKSWTKSKRLNGSETFFLEICVFVANRVLLLKVYGILNFKLHKDQPAGWAAQFV
jgi:hypothetical protein